MLFVVYICFLIIFVVIKPIGLTDRMNSIMHNRIQGNWNYNFVLFRGLSSYFLDFPEPYAYKNILGNTLSYSPLGFLIPTMFKRYRSFIKTISLCFGCIISIEVFQFITMSGFFDVDDIFLNTIGCLLGYFVYFLCRKRSLRLKSCE